MIVEEPDMPDQSIVGFPNGRENSRALELPKTHPAEQAAPSVLPAKLQPTEMFHHDRIREDRRMSRKVVFPEAA